MRVLAIVSVVAMCVSAASADIVITEWMYSGANGEFIEFTNVGAGSVDMTGWSFDDDSQIPGTFDVSTFGVVEAGESVILTDAVAGEFITAWGLSGVTVIGGLSANLGRNDQINLYDAGGTLVDQLSYGDETYAGTPRTQNASCSIPETDYDYTQVQTSWVLSTPGDAFGAWTSSGGDVASPGKIYGFSLCDYDSDGHVDLADFAVFAGCFAGTGVSYNPLPAGCGLTIDASGFIAADADRDSDVDADDYGVFEGCLSGPALAADPTCGHGEAPPADTLITLNGTSITVVGTGATVDGTTATITGAGAYTITGTLNDGQIVVNSAGAVAMTLSGVNITNSTNAPIAIMAADSIEIILANQTTNVLTDATTYVFDNPEDDEPNACLYSKDSMVISGTGTLTVHGNYNDGITSKDDLVITGGTINVDAVDDGIRGKDYLLIQGGAITVVSGDDGLKSDNDGDPLLGYITVEGGTVGITSGGDGITAETDATVIDGSITILSGGGHTVTIPEDLSAKAIKGLVNVVIEGGTLSLDCADDGLHSNNDVTINGGNITVATGDDGVHADNIVEINGGTLTVTDSYEGVEGSDITINDGIIRVTSSDDGINGAGGDGSGGGWPPPAGDHYLYINGGYIAVNAAGDGIDVNGSIEMTGGTVIVHGPTEDFNGAIDYDRTFNISGGLLVATGSSNMAQAPSTSSTQRSVKITYSQWKTAGTLVHMQATSGGADLLTFAPGKSYRSCVFSSPNLSAGLGCSLYRGGTCSGSPSDGLYLDGVYTPGTQTNTFSTTNIVTNVSAP